MIALIQRVKQATVTHADKKATIGQGLLVFVGVAQKDTPKDAAILAHKLTNLRVLADKEGKMNLSLKDTHGQLLLISQFTLIADLKKGFRPSFIKAARPTLAQELFDQLTSFCRESGLDTKTGYFGEYMQVELTNDGPTTIILDTQKL